MNNSTHCGRLMTFPTVEGYAWAALQILLLQMTLSWLVSNIVKDWTRLWKYIEILEASKIWRIKWRQWNCLWRQMHCLQPLHQEGRRSKRLKLKNKGQRARYYCLVLEKTCWRNPENMGGNASCLQSRGQPHQHSRSNFDSEACRGSRQVSPTILPEQISLNICSKDWMAIAYVKNGLF